MYILRQLSAKLAENNQTSIAGTMRLPFRMVDVAPKVKLKVADGKFASDTVALNASDSVTLQLPKDYTAGKRLAVYLKTTQLVKVTVVSPDHGTSTFLVKGVDTATKGDHQGVAAWTGTVTSIAIAAPASMPADAQIDYFLYEVPDLALTASYRNGVLILGKA